jgi:lipoprotein-anchoring transpeptidase ErfK/SrfK
MLHRDHSNHNHAARPSAVVAFVVAVAVLVVVVVVAPGEPAVAGDDDAVAGARTAQILLSANPATRLPPATGAVLQVAAEIELRAAIAAAYAFTAPATPPPEPTDSLLALGFPGDLDHGAQSAAVQVVQQRLVELHLDPGSVDGNFGAATATAIQSFQKLTERDPTGVVDAELWDALAQPLAVAPMVAGAAPTRVEVDLDRQLLVLWKDGQVELVTRVSTGKRSTPTPPGRFHVARRVKGWDDGPFGALYNPLYFNGGIAFHGYPSVPMTAASHGCVRLPMHIAERFPSMVDNGTEVYVVDSHHPGVPFDPPPPPAPEPAPEG